MATHTYVISSATTVGDVTTVTGTVDGIAVSVNVWQSAITKLPNAIAVENFLAPIMLAAAIPPTPTVPVQVPITTFVQ